jgi:hypothetical protein
LEFWQGCRIGQSQIRAQIEAIIAKELYGITRDEWDYLASTFIQGASESRQELNAIFAATRELI